MISAKLNLDPARMPLLVAWVSVLAVIPLLSIFGRSMQFWVARTLGYTVAAWIIGVGLFVCVSFLLVYLKHRQMRIPLVHLAWFITIFLVLPFFLDRVEERLHFLTFGLYGALSMLVLKTRWAIAACLLISGADELLQFYLVDRVGDWRDVAMNSLASLSAALFIRISWRRGVSLETGSRSH